MNIFGVGLPEMGIIMIIALLVFGPKKLPEIGKSLGKAIRAFRTAKAVFKIEIFNRGFAIAPNISDPNPILFLITESQTVD